MTSKSLVVVFCLPGNSFSGKFLECWTKLVHYCHVKGVRMFLSRKESCNIYYVRNMCLGGDVGRGKDQKPFDGKLGYDFIMWIDSDIMFTPQPQMRMCRLTVTMTITVHQTISIFPTITGRL